jgi:S1-C subfamily serine protease
MEIDFTRDKMTWTRLDWKPDPPKGMEGKGGGQGGLEVIGTIMKALGAFLGKKADRPTVARGFLGLEVEENDGVVVVKSVLPGGPAAEAGLKPGDKVRKFKDRSVYGLDELRRFVNKVAPGDSVPLVVERDKNKVDLTVKAGEGF